VSPILESIGSVKGFGWGAFADYTPAYESIATFTATGGESTFTFSSIPQTYKHLQIRGLAKSSPPGSGFQGTGGIFLRYNGISTTSYSRTNLQSDSSSVSFNHDTQSAGYIYNAIIGSYDSPLPWAASIIDIMDYSSTNKNKTTKSFTGVNNNANNTNYKMSLGSFIFTNTAAITEILINVAVNGGTSAAGTTFALYGIRG
jgi:hypothetical protein